MTKHIKILKASILPLVIMAIVSSCYKEPQFDLTPNIEFASITKDIRIDQENGGKKDSIVVAIKYQDGDGDLGYDTEEIGAIIPRTDYNYVVKTQRKVKGAFVDYQRLESLSGFFPRLKNDSKPGPIEGKLNYRIEFYTAFEPFKNDTIRFEIYIKDRAGNKSNTTLSDPIIINQF